MQPAAPKNINKYDVIDLIGRGGMGVVYKAIDRSLNRLVAIKMVTNADEQEGDTLKRFYREAQFTANLRHPNIVTVYELGEFQGSPYLVMEYLPGQSLDSMLARQPMTLLQKLNYVRQVCTGLHYAHTRQPSIIHRDIKPANIVVVEDGTIKIVDFGIARLGQSRNTRSGQLMGSYHYMSPEQINDAELDGRTDIFSTGVVLYQLLTLTLPFEGSGIAQTLHRIVHSPAPPLGQFLKEYPSELNDIVGRALAKNATDRYATANEFAFDLLDVEENLRRQMFGDYLDRAEEFIHDGEFDRAREELAEVLKIDHQHTRANELARQIQQAVTRRQRKDRARDLRSRAEQALEQNRVAEALSTLEQAVKLDNSDTELQSYRDHVLALHQRSEKLNEVLSRAERACSSHDLDGAARAVDEALELDPDSARAKSFKAIIEAKIAERENERQVQQLLGTARQHISTRQFSEALRMLHDAQALNPNVSGLHDLLSVAGAGYQQELRQKALDKSNAEITEALNRSEPSLARNLAMAALAKFPGDRGLLNLKAVAERQIESRKREKAVAGIRVMLAAGEFEAAERQLSTARNELGDSPDLQHLAEQIEAERVRSAQEDVETALREAQDLVRFEAQSQAFETLDTVAHQLRFVPEDLRTRHQQLREQIHERLQTEEKSPVSSDTEAYPSPPDVSGPAPWQTPEHRTFGQTVAGSNTERDYRAPRVDGALARKPEKQDWSVAELTPIDGIPGPNATSKDVPDTLPAVVPRPSSARTNSSPNAPLTFTPPSALEKPSSDATMSAPMQTTSIGQTPAWPDQLLHKVEEQLAIYIGPLARVVVRKTACRTNDPEEFYRTIAEKIEKRADRQAFLARKVQLGPGASLVGPQSQVAAEPQRSAPNVGEHLTPEAVERGTRLLAAYAGPIARVLAKKASQHSDTVRAFYTLLADHIENDADRDRFLRDAGFPNS